MSTPTALGATEGAWCAVCGSAVQIGARRCRRCLTDLIAVPPVREVEAVREPERWAGFVRGVRARLTWRWTFVLLGVAVILAMLARQVLPGEPPIAPQSTRSANAGPLGWSSANGDLAATRTTSAGSSIDGAVAWTATLPASPSAKAIADERAIYLALTNKEVVAVSKLDGRTLWTRTYAYEVTASLTVAAGRLYVTRGDGGVEALDALTGDIAWQVSPLGGYGSAPLVHRGSVYVMFGVSPNEGEGRLVALDAETGALLQSVPGPQAFAAPALALDGDYLAASSSIIEVRHLPSFERSFWLGLKNSSGVAMRDGIVYAAAASETAAFEVRASRPWGDRFRRTWQVMHIRGMAPAPPRVPLVWHISEASPEPFEPVATADEVVLGRRDGGMKAVARVSGIAQWESRLKPMTAPPVLTRDGLLAVHAGELSLLEPTTGRVIQNRSFESGQYGELVQAVPITGTLLVVSATGTVIALGGQ
jgi:hypothetical protein